jgi:hypothetical protein
MPPVRYATTYMTVKLFLSFGLFFFVLFRLNPGDVPHNVDRPADQPPLPYCQAVNKN